MSPLIVRKFYYIAILMIAPGYSSCVLASGPVNPAAYAAALDYCPDKKGSELRVLAGNVLASRESGSFQAAEEDRPPPKVSSLAPPSRPDESLILAKAMKVLKGGDVSGARAIYGYLAAKGSAKGARGVGDTFNPLILKTLPNAAPVSDPVLAGFWYRKAAELENGGLHAIVPLKAASP